MRIRVLSDLHLEFEDYTPDDVSDCDLIILAGDIHTKGNGIDWAQKHFADKTVLYVLGNHEFYKKAYPKLIDDLKEKTKGSNIHILENDVFTVNNINFLGCTLWTNYQLLGDPALAVFECGSIMSDYKQIRISPKYSKFRPIDASAIFLNQSAG